MTCIIGYKDKKNNKVYIGADSCVGNSLGNIHWEKTIRYLNQAKIKIY